MTEGRQASGNPKGLRRQVAFLSYTSTRASSALTKRLSTRSLM